MRPGHDPNTGLISSAKNDGEAHGRDPTANVPQTPVPAVRFSLSLILGNVLLVDRHEHLLQFRLPDWSKLPAALFLNRRICGIHGHC